MDDCSLSQVVGHLSGDEKRRYVEKVKAVGAGDPYLLPPRVFSPVLTLTASAAGAVISAEIPIVTFGDVYSYLINRSSSYTQESLKAYKSLDAYKYFVSGFVHDVLITKASTKTFIVIAKVSHSQRLNDPPLRPWVAFEKSGGILASHCNCKAGLGEVCSHVAGSMFFMEAVAKKHEDTACTSLPCEWIQPSRSKGQYKEVCEMDFTSVHAKKRKLDAAIADTPTLSVRKSKVPPMTNEEVSKLHSDLRASGVACAVLSLVKDHAQHFIPEGASVQVPKPLSELYCDDTANLSDEDVASRCEELFASLSITSAQAAEVERLTRKQARSKLWFQQRTGRLTASKFGRVMKTPLDNPAKSLVKQICYPNSYKFSTEATRWGCKHEDHARKLYHQQMQSAHQNFRVQDSGLQIHPNYPYLGATPDGIINCDCCGTGVLEIKCPFCKKGMDLKEAATDSKFCLESQDDTLQLKRDHVYYYQVQGQMLITDTKYSDFVVWTDDQQTLFTERISFDEQFLSGVIERLQKFFKLCVLPELLSKRILQSPVNSTETQVWCYCRVSDAANDMVHCNQEDCKIGKFHLTCLGLKRKPKKTWICLDCRKHKQAKNKN